MSLQVTKRTFDLPHQQLPFRLYEGHVVMPMGGHVCMSNHIIPCNARGACVVRIKISLPDSLSPLAFQGPPWLLLLW